MDLNELLYQHQLALIHARASLPGENREAYSKIADHYAGRLRAYRSRNHIRQYSGTTTEDELRSPLPSVASCDEAALSFEEIEMISLAAARHGGTTEERKVLALEMIADQLLLLHADLLAIDAHSRSDIPEQTPSQDVSAADDAEGREDAGEQLDVPEGGLPPGVTVKTMSVYSVGPYTYSDLSSALLEAARQSTH
ncbi:hypothetical protein WBP07_01340 [Novosphingobium sp. BL-8A]|uniref:hypothetical protein n=1 Tax=Novosphingobium sp. BL-8A TaxID=3127639 RepID=UPI0037567F26